MSSDAPNSATACVAKGAWSGEHGTARIEDSLEFGIDSGSCEAFFLRALWGGIAKELSIIRDEHKVAFVRRCSDLYPSQDAYNLTCSDLPRIVRIQGCGATESWMFSRIFLILDLGFVTGQARVRFFVNLATLRAEL